MLQAEIRADCREMNTNHPPPVWYRHLRTCDFSEAWLNGLSSSSVWLFSEKKPRSGIVLDPAHYDKDCPPLRFFITGGLPLWLVWTAQMEEGVHRCHELDYLWPPDELLEHAQPPVAAAAAQPSQGMLEKDDEYERLCNHWRDFFKARRCCRMELERTLSDKERQRYALRKQNKPTMSAHMYEWKKIMTSGGKEVYVRCRVIKRKNLRVLSLYTKLETHYDPFFNEWDFCREFSGKSASVVVGFSLDESSDDDADYVPSEKRLSPLPPKLPSPRTPPRLPVPHTLPGTPPRHDLPESAGIDTDVVHPTPFRLPTLATLPRLPGPSTSPRSLLQHNADPADLPFVCNSLSVAAEYGGLSVSVAGC